MWLPKWKWKTWVSNYENDIEAVLAANVAVICTGKEVCESNFLTLQDHSFHFHLAWILRQLSNPIQLLWKEFTTFVCDQAHNGAMNILTIERSVFQFHALVGDVCKCSTHSKMKLSGTNHKGDKCSRSLKAHVYTNFASTFFHGWLQKLYTCWTLGCSKHSERCFYPLDQSSGQAQERNNWEVVFEHQLQKFDDFYTSI